ncbi:hypothetical protein GQ600_20936 [Phytophthora cactorum]|nr:hypothetical protein GQ600_20936 [Phytophthora cactorum]
MVHLTHSALHWRLRCINDTSSEDEDTAPNILSSKYKGPDGASSDTGTATRSWRTPAHSKARSKTVLPQRPSTPARFWTSILVRSSTSVLHVLSDHATPVAKFVEVGNGRRVTAVVSSTQYIRRGQEVTVDYGDDMWFIGRCLPARCRHRDIQDENDP